MSSRSICYCRRCATRRLGIRTSAQAFAAHRPRSTPEAKASRRHLVGITELTEQGEANANSPPFFFAESSPATAGHSLPCGVTGVSLLSVFLPRPSSWAQPTQTKHPSSACWSWRAPSSSSSFVISWHVARCTAQAQSMHSIHINIQIWEPFHPSRGTICR